MSIKKIIFTVTALIIIGGFASLGIADAANTKNHIEFQKVQLKTKESEINKLNVRYEKLNQELDNAAKEKVINQAELNRLQKEKEDLNKQKLDLEAQLQAKIDQKAKLAAASNRAINTATGTQTASAASYSSGSVQAIIIEAANRYGVSVDRALRIAKCESTYRPNEVNYNYWEEVGGIKYYPSGLFQHLTNYWPTRAAKYGYAGASVFDAVANANVTMGMWRDGSQGLWECS